MKRGFTLVELLATLIVLSVVAIIVVPNIYENITEVQEGLYNNQLQSIKDSAKNWSVDNIEKISCTNNEPTYVFLEELIDGGYIDENLYKSGEQEPLNGNIFVLIKCNTVEQSDNNNMNYKYTYDVYDTNEKHLSYLAELYAKKNNLTSGSVTLSELLPLATPNLKIEESSQLKNIEDGSLINNATVLIEYIDNKYIFTVSIDE